MSRKTISYATLKQVLLDIGFVEKRTSGSHQIFAYPQTDIVIVLPISPGRQVSKSHMAAVRRTIIENGVMTLEEFEELVEGTK